MMKRSSWQTKQAKRTLCATAKEQKLFDFSDGTKSGPATLEQEVFFSEHE